MLQMQLKCTELLHHILYYLSLLLHAPQHKNQFCNLKGLIIQIPLRLKVLMAEVGKRMTESFKLFLLYLNIFTIFYLKFFFVKIAIDFQLIRINNLN